MRYKKARSRNAYIYNKIIGAGLLVHIFCQGMFMYMDIPVLYMYNIISILVFSLSLFFTKKYEEAVLTVAMIEATFFSFLTSIILGEGFGFKTWLLILALSCAVVPSKHTRRLRALSHLQLLIFVLVPFLEQENTHMGIQSIAEFVLFFNSVAQITIFLLVNKTLEVSKAVKNLNLMRQYENLKRYANYDELTGLTNRRYMGVIFKKIDEEISKGSKKYFYMVFIDVDDFKRINDTYGHFFGDYVLQTTAKIIKETSGASIDNICRWGGDEFIIILEEEDNNTKKVWNLLEKIRKTIEDTSFFANTEEKIDISVSIGCTLISGRGNVEDAIHEADILMYRSKSRGKNKVVMDV